MGCQLDFNGPVQRIYKLQIRGRLRGCPGSYTQHFQTVTGKRTSCMRTRRRMKQVMSEFEGVYVGMSLHSVHDEGFENDAEDPIVAMVGRSAEHVTRQGAACIVSRPKGGIPINLDCVHVSMERYINCDIAVKDLLLRRVPKVRTKMDLPKAAKDVNAGEPLMKKRSK